MTLFVFFTCLVASSGGLIFGYDIGISGGVTAMDSFLEKFFPAVYGDQKQETITNQYCKFDSQTLALFTSSLYLAVLIASFFASSVTRAFGRRNSMLGGGATFLAGAAINGSAKNIAMLIIDRILLGIGVGFANQVMTHQSYILCLYDARMSRSSNVKPRRRCIFPRCSGEAPWHAQHWFSTYDHHGILIANIINHGTSKISGGWGWSVGLGLAAVPAIIITLGALILPDTPNSLVERGQTEKAKTMLCRIRGSSDVQEEYDDLVAASDASKVVKHPWSTLSNRKYRPQLVMSFLILMFQQLTGINMVMFYAPVLFKTIGFDDDASLMAAVITGLVNAFAQLFRSSPSTGSADAFSFLRAACR
ncbi:hypothetical protein C4D60_Mb01t29440 [Musa balbisiana]|uniref:Major facilitator superfamily (MFS) profile domain-containing protein n=1 Tax=Musa balbisiana TaxID=52838 RepID=A0A4S8JRN9_MUSBA|nr:hypothetical protein C4D60_Mb01t29440 [Musa balbisiana]